MKLKYVSIVFAFILLGCNGKSLDEKFSKQTYNEDISIFLEKRLITEEEKMLLANYIFNNLTDSTFHSKTYSEILSTAIFKKEMADRLAKELLEKKNRINASLEVKVIRKYLQKFIDGGYFKDFLLIDIIAQNKTDKEIGGFRVVINFKNSDGITFYSADWILSEPIGANSKKTIPLSTGEFSNSNFDQSKLKMADLSKIEIEYDIRSLMYDDGTTLSLD